MLISRLAATLSYVIIFEVRSSFSGLCSSDFGLSGGSICSHLQGYFLLRCTNYRFCNTLNTNKLNKSFAIILTVSSEKSFPFLNNIVPRTILFLLIEPGATFVPHLPRAELTWDFQSQCHYHIIPIEKWLDSWDDTFVCRDPQDDNLIPFPFFSSHFPIFSFSHLLLFPLFRNEFFRLPTSVFRLFWLFNPPVWCSAGLWPDATDFC
jgi:hypothetical protein